MQRYRFTLLAVCFVLLFLGVHDLLLMLRNPEPAKVPIADLEQGGAPREWLTVTGGDWDLREAISTSGSIEIEAFLVPLRSGSDPAAPIEVMVETRDPGVVNLLTTYYFKFDSEAEREAFVAANAGQFSGQRDVTGMVVGGLIASGNRDKMLELARELKMPVSDDVVFLSEGQEPGKVSGLFFTLMALLGMVKVFQLMRRPPVPAASSAPAE